MDLNLENLLADRPPSRGRSQRRLDPAVQRERNLERNRRTMEAKRLTAMAMERLHPDDYAALFAQARARVDRERGPLPGDDAD